MPPRQSTAEPASSRAALYIRRSKDDAPGSIPVQQDATRAYAARHELVVVAEELDQESAWLGGESREGYQRLLELARTGQIHHLVVWQFTRFGRDQVEAVQRYRELKRLGVRLHSTMENLDNDFIVGLFALLAEDESRRISERVKPAKRRKAALGFHQGNQPPLGTLKVKGKLTPGPRFAEIRRAFDLAAAGEGLSAIARALEAEYGRTYRFSTLSRALRNPAYVGHLRGIQPDGRRGIVPNAWPAMIPLDVWERAQFTLSTRERHPIHRQANDRYWFTPFLVCGVCGHRGRIHHTPVKTRAGRVDYSYARCLRPGCTVAHRADTVAAWLHTELAPLQAMARVDASLERVVRSFIARATEVEDSQAVELARERQALTARRERIAALMIDGHLPADLGRAQLIAVEAELGALGRRAAALPSSGRLDHAALRLWQSGAWDAAAIREDVQGYRRVMAMLVERVEIGPKPARTLHLTEFGAWLKSARNA